MNNQTLKKLVLYLSVAFVVISIWRDPSGSADAAGEFLGSVGGFFSTLIDKLSEFFKGLGDDNDGGGGVIVPQTTIP